jgi:putative two-component system response regulator
MGLAAVLHDIGKIRVAASILKSPEQLKDGEWEVMRCHTTWGADFLANRPGFEQAADVAYCHHERWDGSGYPQGIVGDAIPEAAAIVSVADAFDAMVQTRPYRQGRSVDNAIAEIVAGSGSQFSPKVVTALVHLHQSQALTTILGTNDELQSAA